MGYEYSHESYLAKRQRLGQIPHAHVHWYGKAESRPGRKLGHVNVLLYEQSQYEGTIAKTIESLWYGP